MITLRTSSAERTNDLIDESLNFNYFPFVFAVVYNTSMNQKIAHIKGDLWNKIPFIRGFNTDVCPLCLNNQPIKVKNIPIFEEHVPENVG